MTRARYAAEAARLHCLLVREAALAVGSMFSHVFGLGFVYTKIRWVIVPDVAIDVVNDLAPAQWSPEHLRRHQPMHRPLPRLLVVDGVRGKVNSSAPVGAEPPASLPRITWPNGERRSALLAGALLSAASRYRVARLRAPSPFARHPALFARIHARHCSTSPWFSPACLRPGARAAKETARHDDLPLFRGAL